MNESKRDHLISLFKGVKELPKDILDLDLDTLTDSKDLTHEIEFLNLWYHLDSLKMRAHFGYFLDECVSNDEAFGTFLTTLSLEDMRIAPALFRYLRRTCIEPVGDHLELLLKGISGEELESRAEGIILLSKQSKEFITHLISLQGESNPLSFNDMDRYAKSRALKIAKDISMGVSLTDLSESYPDESKWILLYLSMKSVLKKGPNLLEVSL